MSHTLLDIAGGSPYYIVNYDGEKLSGAGKAIAKNYWNPFFNPDKEGLQGKIMTKVTYPPRLTRTNICIVDIVSIYIFKVS